MYHSQNHDKCPPPADIPAYLDEISPPLWSSRKEAFLSNSLYQEREALFMAYQPGNVDLVCLGDSITQKFEWQDALPAWRVANRGIGSDTTGGMCARLDSIKVMNPVTISLMAGVNDLMSQTPEDSAASYAALLDALAQELPKTTVIVTGVLPVTEAHSIDNQNIRTLNQFIADICQKRNIRFLDLYGVFAGEDGCLKPQYALDTVHLSPEGYRLWLSYLVPVLKDVLPSQQ